MNIKKRKVLFLFFCILAASGAIAISVIPRYTVNSKPTEENTVNKNSEWHSKWFQQKLFSLTRDGDAVIAVYENNMERWTKGFVITHPDDHGFTSYIIEEFEETGVKLSYKTTFDHRSFGKNLISRDKGTFTIPWIPSSKLKGDLIELSSTIKKFIIAFASKNETDLAQLIIPHQEYIGILPEINKYSPEEIETIRNELAYCSYMTVEEINIYGYKLLQSDETFPAGTTAAYIFTFDNDSRLIPIEKTSQGWKFDLRFWLAGKKVYNEDTPEFLVRKFMADLICCNKNGLSEIILSPSNHVISNIVHEKAKRDSFYKLITETMPVTEASPGTGMVLPDGKILRALTNISKHKWVTALYGAKQLIFELKREKNTWKIIPYDYLPVIGIGEKLEIPEGWRCVMGETAGKYWKEFACASDPDIEKILEMAYEKCGSQYDGDAQLYTAFLLAELNKDPYQNLQEMLKSKDEAKRAFAIMVIGNLGDKRFYNDIKKLLTDNTPFPDHFENTMAEKAKFALNKMWAGGETLGTATWLIYARCVKCDD